MPALRRRVVVSTYIIKLLIFGLLYSGFITNFLSVTQINSGTLLIDLLVVLLLLHLSFKLIAGYYIKLRINKVYFYFLIFWLLLLLLSTIKLFLIDSTPITEGFLGVRNNLFYMAPLLYIPLFFKRTSSVTDILKLFLHLGLCLTVFSFVQFFLSSKLPDSLLVLRGESVFGFYNTDIVRPTALLGNTIIYASFTLVLFAFYLTRYLYHRKRTHLFIIFMIGLANLLTFTRASIVGLVIVVLVCVFLKYARPTLLFTIKIVCIILTLSTIVSIGFYLNKNSFLVQRLTGKEASTQGSTNEHITQIKNAVLYLKEHPIAGAGVGSQGASGDPSKKIITDGYWFQVMLENGVPLGLLYVLFHFICPLFALTSFYRTEDLLLKKLCMAFVAVSAYFFAASFLNSGFAGRANYISYWLIFGTLIAQYIIVKKSQNATSRY